MAERVRRLRAGFANPHPGGVGAPPGVTTDPCREPADAQAAAQVAPWVLARKRGPTPEPREKSRGEDAAVERREARALRKGRAAPRKVRIKA